jgi:hypothetical protein
VPEFIILSYLPFSEQLALELVGRQASGGVGTLFLPPPTYAF